jgi:hypothetical protein
MVSQGYTSKLERWDAIDSYSGKGNIKERYSEEIGYIELVRAAFFLVAQRSFKIE